MNYARTGDTLLHLRSSYIQCSPRKRTSTAKLLALRNIQSLHIETVWDEKKKTLNIFTLGWHTVALSCQFMSVTFSSWFASCSYLPGKHCLISPFYCHSITRGARTAFRKGYEYMYKCKILSVRWNHRDCLTLSLTHSLNPVFEVLLWMSKMPIQNLFVLFLLLMLTLREA